MKENDNTPDEAVCHNSSLTAELSDTDLERVAAGKGPGPIRAAGRVTGRGALLAGRGAVFAAGVGVRRAYWGPYW